MTCKKHICSRRKPNWSEYGPREAKTDGNAFKSRKMELKKIGDERRKRVEERREREMIRLAQDIAGARQIELAHALTR